NIRGQKIEDDARKITRQALAQCSNILRGGAMFFPERDENVRVSRADQARGGVLQIQCAVGQPDVIENVVHLIGWHGPANVLLDEVAEPGCLLDAGTALGAHMKDERARVAAGEEVLAKERHQQKGT